MRFLEPWCEFTDTRLVNELRHEIPLGHFLENVEVSVIGCRKDRDDFLFVLNDGTGRLVAVHLTYPETKATNPKFPTTRVFENHESWLDYMEAAHAAWIENDPDGQFWLKEQKLWDEALIS